MFCNDKVTINYYPEQVHTRETCIIGWERNICTTENILTTAWKCNFIH